jgi:integrase
VLSDHRTGQLIVDERVTVQQFFETWLASVKRSVAFSTWQRYETLIRLHATPSIGPLRLARLSPLHLEQLYSGRLDAGLSPTTVLQLHRVLHHALRDAMRWNPMQRNVSELVTPPRKAHYEFQVISSQQARTFLEAVKGDRLEALYVLAITTGMREGELFGLRWEDVNLTTRSLHLVKQLKTKSSRRQVLLPRIAFDTLSTPPDPAGRPARPRWHDVGGPRPGLHQRPGSSVAPEELPTARLLSPAGACGPAQNAVPRPAPQRRDSTA